jgi:hypothetical protein
MTELTPVEAVCAFLKELREAQENTRIAAARLRELQKRIAEKASYNVKMAGHAGELEVNHAEHPQLWKDLSDKYQFELVSRLESCHDILAHAWAAYAQAADKINPRVPAKLATTEIPTET